MINKRKSVKSRRNSNYLKTDGTQTKDLDFQFDISQYYQNLEDSSLSISKQNSHHEVDQYQRKDKFLQSIKNTNRLRFLKQEVSSTIKNLEVRIRQSDTDNQKLMHQTFHVPQKQEQPWFIHKKYRKLFHRRQKSEINHHKQTSPHIGYIFFNSTNPKVNQFVTKSKITQTQTLKTKSRIKSASRALQRDFGTQIKISLLSLTKHRQNARKNHLRCHSNVLG